MLIGNIVSSQETKTIIPPLYTYLQNNSDSTIILTYDRDPIIPARHFILSKKDNIITLYLYESPYDRKGKDLIPKNVRNFFQKRDIEINSLKIDTNSYFNAKYVKPKKRQDLWHKTISFNLWQIKDDITEGEGCSNVNKEIDGGIYDGGSICLYLITPDNIQRLYFYAPAYYHKKCPKEKNGRMVILKLEQLFKKYYGKE